METEITRLIASAIAALVLGYVLYVAAYVKHKTEKQEDYYSYEIREKDFSDVSGDAPRAVPAEVSLKKEKSESWCIGYRLAETRRAGEKLDAMQLATNALSKELVEYIRSDRFDAVVFTHPFAGMMCSTMKRRGQRSLLRMG